MKTTSEIVFDRHTQKLVDALKSVLTVPMYQQTPAEARQTLETIQSKPVQKPAVDIEEKAISGPKGKIPLLIFRPQNSTETLPVILFIHGGGWVIGSANTHDFLICELAVGVNAAVVFVNYSLSPESKFPVAIEEVYAALNFIAQNGKSMNLDATRLAVVGDSAGGNLSIATTFLAKERKGPTINAQVLLYPVTDGECNSPSYQQYAEGPILMKRTMEWYWNAYEPSTSARQNPLLSPVKATREQLQNLPAALIITAECDVLRDEGEEYARKLMQAGVDVTSIRYEGAIHDFMILHALAQSPSTRSALDLTCSFLRGHLKQKK